MHIKIYNFDQAHPQFVPRSSDIVRYCLSDG